MSDPDHSEFSERGYVKIANVLHPGTLEILHQYVQFQQQSNPAYFKDKKNSIGRYSDFPGEGLLLQLKERAEEILSLQLYPTFSYLECFTKGKFESIKKNNSSCEFTMVVPIGADDPTMASVVELKNDTLKYQIDLSPGQILLYHGTKITNCQFQISQKEWFQFYLHYVDVNGPYKAQKFDKRDHVGTLPNAH